MSDEGIPLDRAIRFGGLETVDALLKYIPKEQATVEASEGEVRPTAETISLTILEVYHPHCS